MRVRTVQERERDRLRSMRHHPVRARTFNMKSVPKRELERERVHLQLLEETDPLGPVHRPRTRADCIDGPRPCPFVSCRHHLYLDVGAADRSITIRFPDLDPDELPESCSLDVARDVAGGDELTLERVAELLNITRERVRQIELVARAKLRARLEEARTRAIHDRAR